MELTCSDPVVRGRLVFARHEMKYTLQEAADAAGVSRTSLARWEKGRGSPSLEELRALCLLYGVTPSWLLFGGDVLSDVRQALMPLRPQVKGGSTA